MPVSSTSVWVTTTADATASPDVNTSARFSPASIPKSPATSRPNDGTLTKNAMYVGATTAICPIESCKRSS